MECSDNDENEGGEVTIGKYTFSSDFDSGNGHRWNLVDDEYIVWTRPDCEGEDTETGFKTWFHFYIKGGVKGETIKLRIRGLNAHSKLYGRDMRPVVRSDPSEQSFERVRQAVEYKQDEEKQKIEIKFKHRFEYDNETTYIAFTYPYSYQQLQDRLDVLDRTFLQHRSIYYHRELIIPSLEGRNVELLTVTERNSNITEREEMIEGLFPNGPDSRPLAHNKPVFFVSARVHPGEVPAQWVLEGVLNFVLDPDDPRAAALRKMFVVKILPMINPDGVARGFYRSDTQGLNLNRFYADPDPSTHPSIFGAQKVMMQLHDAGLLEYYFDLHAHACRRGCFIYGNAIPDVKKQIENVLLIRLIAVNTPHLDFDGCNFTERNMKAKDKRDGLSKEGSGRVGMYKHTDLTHCYTLECNYNTGRTVNAIPDACTNDPRCSPGRTPDRRVQPPKYTPESYQHVGKGIAVAVCDHVGINPWSRLSNSHAGSLDGLRCVVANGLASSSTTIGQEYRRQIKELGINTALAKVKPPPEPEKPKIAPKPRPKPPPKRAAPPLPAAAGEGAAPVPAQEGKKVMTPLPRVARGVSAEQRRRSNEIRTRRRLEATSAQHRVMFVPDQNLAERALADRALPGHAQPQLVAQVAQPQLKLQTLLPESLFLQAQNMSIQPTQAHKITASRPSMHMMGRKLPKREQQARSDRRFIRQMQDVAGE